MAGSANIPVLSHFEGKIGKLREMRFWSKVAMGAPEECWDWKGSVAGFGYGRFKVCSYTTLHANRVAWALKHRSDPGALVVRHSCDRPICCNPAHLLIGTVADNNNDKLARGRHRCPDMRGAKNPNASLGENDVAKVVTMFREGFNNTQISAHVSVGHSLVSRIRTGRSWQREAARLGWKPAVKWVAANDPELFARLSHLEESVS